MGQLGNARQEGGLLSCSEGSLWSELLQVGGSSSMRKTWGRAVAASNPLIPGVAKTKTKWSHLLILVSLG